MKEFEWTFGSANYIDVKRVGNVSSSAHFTYDDHLKISVNWTTESFTEGEWAAILACVKQAKDILKKMKRI
jgi:hypothetical protein